MRLPTPVLFLLALLPTAPAAAQSAPPPCRLCDGSGDALVDPVEKVPVAIQVETSLEFDRVILTGAAGGIARLGPDGSRSTSGALAPMTGRTMNGEVLIRGEPGRAIRVDLPSRIDLFGYAGGTLTISRVTSDLAGMPRLDARGELRVRFGGELFVSGDAEGTYRGDVAITVDYL